jgi:hypothetical protein
MLKNTLGERVISKSEVESMSQEVLAKTLREINLYRRGQGKYQWSAIPSKNKPCPFSPDTIGFVIDEAAERIAKTRIERKSQHG